MPHAPSSQGHLALDGARLRRDFPILARMVHGRPLVYLDNAASFQKPQAVPEEVNQMDRQDMLDLLGIPLTTMRVKCAMLPLRTLQKALRLYESSG